MRQRLSRVAWVALALASPATLAAQGGAQPNNGGAAFLLVPVGGRASALGQAAVADGGTTESAFWNPAGLATLAQSELAFHHAETFASQNNAIATYFASHSLGVVGVAAYLVDYGVQPVVPGPDQPPVGELSPKNIELLASYAAPLTGALSLGVNYKIVQFRQDCAGLCGNFQALVGTTHAVDVGMQYDVDDALTVGMVVRHAGFKLQVQNRDQADPLPTQVQVGMAYRVFLPGVPGNQRADARLLVDLHDAWGEYGNPDANVGAELGYGDVIRLRAGYAFLHSEGSGPSIGFGARFGNLMIDFARIFYSSGTFDEPAFLSVRVAL